MAYTYTIQRDPSMVLMRRIGPPDVEEWRATMLLLVAHPDFEPGMPILFDVRGNSQEPDRGQGRALAAVWKLLVPYSRVAIVAGPTDAFGLARQLELLTGDQVRAFTDSDKAKGWLFQLAGTDADR
jgi:hypothetical protein